MNIIIPDYGCGNLASIARMVEKAGYTCRVMSDPNELGVPDKIILAGVGAFDHGMRELHERGWVKVLNELVLDQGIPILGICLGMQLMCNNSEEGKAAGLGWIDAEVKRFRFSDRKILKVPHMGWNTVAVKKANPWIDVGDEEERFYFVHSYYVSCNCLEDVLMETEYGQIFCSAVARKNLLGVQFHPEKSHRFGLRLLKNFLGKSHVET